MTDRTPTAAAYDEATIRDALERLWRKEWARLASGQGSRSVKYRQLVEETLDLASDESAVLCVLMLRGPQTLGELRTRTERLHDFAGLGEVQETLDALARRDEPLVVKLERLPGQKEARFAHLLSGEIDVEAIAAAHAVSHARGGGGAERIEHLEEEVASLRSEVETLKQTFEDFRKQFE